MWKMCIKFKKNQTFNQPELLPGAMSRISGLCRCRDSGPPPRV